MIRILLIISLLSISPVLLNSQTKVVTEEWHQIIAGPVNGYDSPNDMVLDESGNIYITGVYSENNSRDFCTIKYDNNGNLLWMRTYNGIEHLPDESKAIALDDSGNVYVAGFSSGLTSSRDFTIIKYNSNGIQQWVTSYNGPGGEFDEALDITVSVDGCIYSVGTTNPAIGKDEKNVLILKLNSSGDILWSEIFNSPDNDNDYGTNIKMDSNGDILCAGFEGSYPLVIKCDTSGVLQWVSVDTTISIWNKASIIINDEDYIYFTSASYFPTNRNYTSKISPNGVIVWKHYEGIYSIPYSITLDDSGNVITAGHIQNSSTSLDIFIVKYNPDGILQWYYRYNSGGNNEDFARDVVTDSVGNIYITGTVGTSTDSYKDFAVLKLNLSGELQWIVTHDQGVFNSEQGHLIRLDNQYNIIASGINNGRYNGGDILTLKWSQIVGIQQLSSETPSKFELEQNYPNPFNPSTSIKFKVQSLKFVELKVYDVMGKEVAVLLKENLSPGEYEVSFNGTEYSSGVYFYRIDAGDFSEIKKMMLVK